MSRVPLADLARARCGDKGDIVDVTLFAKDEAAWRAIRREVTAERVREHLAFRVKGNVERYEVETMRALKLVLHQALDGGASRSIRTDNVGRCFAPMLLRMDIEAEASAPA